MIDVAPLPTLPVVDSDERFPVRRILCVAKNYAAHVREMGDDPSRVPPTFFDKPLSALSAAPEVPYPRETHDLHYEVELVLALGAGARGPIEPRDADALIYGVACGLDLTRRDLQQSAKERGGPWDLAKGFRSAAPVGALRRVREAPVSGAIELRVNGELRQHADLSHMIWDSREVVAQLSRYDDLEPGDLIFTGTPEGVGAVQAGDRLQGRIAGVGAIDIRIV